MQFVIDVTSKISSSSSSSPSQPSFLHMPGDPPMQRQIVRPRHHLEIDHALGHFDRLEQL